MTFDECLAGQEAWFREKYPAAAGGMDALGVSFCEYWQEVQARQELPLYTATSTQPRPPVHWDIRTNSWHSEGE